MRHFDWITGCAPRRANAPGALSRFVRPLALAALVALSPSVAGLVAAQAPVRAAAQPAAQAQDLVVRLEQALNASDSEGLEALVAPGQLPQWLPRLQRFTQRFSNARWQLKAGAPLPDGRLPVAVSVEGSTEKDGLMFSLQASQSLALSTEAGLITDQEVLNEQSLLVNSKGALPVTLLIPDTVLTGSRYDVDVILDEPLGQAMVAGGLIALTPAQVLAQASPDIQLEPLGSGGLFKSVQAPFQPGVQTWAAMLVHPDGVITVTKQVRVVSDLRRLGF